jgi:hypothetical protein
MDVKDVPDVKDFHKEQDVHVLNTVPEFRDGIDVKNTKNIPAFPFYSEYRKLSMSVIMIPPDQ